MRTFTYKGPSDQKIVLSVFVFIFTFFSLYLPFCKVTSHLYYSSRSRPPRLAPCARRPFERREPHHDDPQRIRHPTRPDTYERVSERACKSVYFKLVCVSASIHRVGAATYVRHRIQSVISLSRRPTFANKSKKNK